MWFSIGQEGGLAALPFPRKASRSARECARECVVILNKVVNMLSVLFSSVVSVCFCGICSGISVYYCEAIVDYCEAIVVFEGVLLRLYCG